MGGDSYVSYPILYNANETNFEHLGVSVLSDALSAFVTKKKNDIYILEIKYPVNGKDFHKIKLDMIIKSSAGNRTKPQRFIVSKITKNKDGDAEIYCEHFAQARTRKNSLRPNVSASGNAGVALEQWRSSLLYNADDFSVWSDITTNADATWRLGEFDNAREVLGGREGSILDIWGGEYEFDNLNIKLHERMGVDSGVIIAYGRNLIDLNQEDEILDTYTTIYPFKKVTEGDVERLITLPNLTLDSKHRSKYAHTKILQVDFSSDEAVTDEKTLESRA